MESKDKANSFSEYNPIFEKLVVSAGESSKDRLIGMLAYADYKEEKYLWKQQYRQRYNVDSVPSDSVKDFLLAYHDDKLDKLRNDAEEVLYIFAESYANPRENQAYERGKEDALVEQMRSQKEGWWISGLKGALGSAIFAFIAFVLSVLFSLANPENNYSKLVQFVVGGKDFIIQPQETGDHNKPQE